jgi:tyrosyl-tRNA synthetase
MDQIEESLTRRAQQILPTKQALELKLRSGDKIRLYQGFDPSSPNLHVGHLVGLLQLKAFQDLGHEVIFLIGDFTGMIGDPTDKSATRPKLTREQVLENAKTYKDQAGRILRFEGENAASMKFNSEWLEKLSFSELIELSSNFTIQQFIERDMFQDRLENNKPIFLHEFLYPLMVTYDAITMQVDLELGGNDQLFNMSVGRSLVKTMTGKEKFVMTTKLLTDGEGRKIGKTTGNAINLFGKAEDLFGAIMSQPDSIIIPGFEMVTTIPLDEIETIKSQVTEEPLRLKKRLAFEVVKLCQGETAALGAQAHFESTFQSKSFTDLPEIRLSKSTFSPVDLLAELGAGDSNADKKRLIRDGAVAINDHKITDLTMQITITNGDTIKIGKTKFYKLLID